MPKTVLLTIGRLPKALDIARSFAHAGYRVIVADPFKRHLTGISNTVDRSYQVCAPVHDRAQFLQDLLDITVRERIELLIPISEETMYVAALRDRLPAGVGIFSMPQKVVLRLHNKQRFIETCVAHGLTAPATYALTDSRAASLAASVDFVVKPVHSCSGRGVRFFGKGAPLPPVQLAEAEIVQAKVAGDLYSTFSIAQDGRTRATVIYRAAVMSGTVAVAFERIPSQPAIAKWVESFVAKEHFTGFVAFDMIVDAAGNAFAIECNPRATSGVHFIRSQDLAAAIVDPDATSSVGFRDNLVMQQVYPCLTETQKSVFKSKLFRSNLRHLLSARDVTWDAKDPLPLLLMPYTASQIMWRSITKGQSFGEASTFDIGWRDPEINASAG